MPRMTRAYAGVATCVLLTCLASQSAAATPADPYEAVDSSWDRFGSVFGRIIQDYYAPVPADSIMLGAIQGMLGRLDAYSHYYDAEGLRQLRQDTTGKFAGLGITVAVMHGHPVVVAPLEDTPAEHAGLATGDMITEIEGRDTRDMPLDDVVDMLRGDPGTDVRITVHHPAPHPTTRELTITRHIIRIRSVTFIDQVAPGVGYIGMRRSRFSEDTAHEVDAALAELIDGGARSIVLDLRGNPGGLLSQATQVADHFLPRGAPIVSIRERDGRREEVRRSQQRPSAGDLPLVVLIDGGSASASEIVAGAIQDNDRGIILGTTSFGKGSVQTIFALHESKGSVLKLTTARYYTPSGRSIHRDPHSVHMPGRRRISVGDRQIPLSSLLQIIAGAHSGADARDALCARFELDADTAARLLGSSLRELLQDAATSSADTDTSVAAAHEAYRTRAGRRVYGGGGIAPDIVVPGPAVPHYVLELQRLGLFFEFVVTRLAADSSLVAHLEGDALDEHLLEEFARFSADRTDLPGLGDGVNQQLQALRRELETLGLVARVAPAIQSIASSVALPQGYPPALRREILRRLKTQLALRFHGRRAESLARLTDDAQLTTAVELLLDEAVYTEALRNGS
jgi:carboxyl-terminal processing protease